jgi:hypothetical protein
VALSTSTRPVTAGLNLVPGSLQLILLRWALVALAAVPAMFAAIVGIAATVARQPYFTDVRGPLPIAQLLRLSREVPPGILATLALAAVLALVGQQVLVAGALHWLEPARGPRPSSTEEPVALVVIKSGGRWLWAMLRVVLLAAALSTVGLIAIDCLFERLVDHGTGQGWTGRTLWLRLPLLEVAASLVWAAIVGAWAFWCRVLMVADGRRRVRSAGVLVLRVWWRRPLAAPLFFVVLTLAMLLGSAAVLALWRQHPPTALPGVIPLAVTWLLVLLVQAMAWHWLLRAARLLYADASLEDLRSRPDAPLGVGRLVRRLLRRKTK